MSKLAFLQNITVVADERPRSTGGARKEWNPPSGLTIRIWKDGSVYPSEDLVKKFELEYRQKLSDDELKQLKEASKPRPFPGNGFDIADTQDFPIFKTNGERFLIISAAEKDAGKVDLFSTTNYEDDGTPKTSVMDQGAATFGKDYLIPRIEEIYGLVFARPAIEAKEAVAEERDEAGAITVKARPAVEAVAAVEGMEYVDMIFLGQAGENSDPFLLPAGKKIAFFPKQMVKGTNKGEMTTARRENPQMYIFYPKALIESEPSGNGQS